MLERFNYCMILIIFIVNTSEFACFFFTSRDCHEGRQRLLTPTICTPTKCSRIP